MSLSQPLTDGDKAIIREIAREVTEGLERRMADAIKDGIRLHAAECASSINGRMAQALKAAIECHSENCVSRTTATNKWRLLALCAVVSLLGGAGANATLGPLLKVLFQGLTGS
jgi:hypothetical protein